MREKCPTPIIGELELRCRLCKVWLEIFRLELPAALIAAFSPSVPDPPDLTLGLTVELPMSGDSSTGVLVTELFVSWRSGSGSPNLYCGFFGDRLNADLTNASRPALYFSDVRLSLSFSSSESSISLALL